MSNVNTSHHIRNKIIAIKIDHLKENSSTYDWNHIKEQNLTILLNRALIMSLTNPKQCPKDSITFFHFVDQ